MINNIKKQVFELLCSDNSGHNFDHIRRVLELALKFAEREKADKDVVALIALLHDVDDYKLFGSENAENLTNAKKIMNSSSVPENIQIQVLKDLKCIGYSKALKGIRPTSIEGKIVSDADMCDAIGVNGFLRVCMYSINQQKPIFDRNIFPIENMTAEEYKKRDSDHVVSHLFEKILKLKDMMLTEAGKDEARARHQITVDMLYQLFDEENAPEWTEYLNKYLNK